MTGGGAICTSTLRVDEMNLLATAREVNVATLNVLDDLTGMLLGLVGGVGVGDVGLRNLVYQTSCTGKSELAHIPCGHRRHCLGSCQRTCCRKVWRGVFGCGGLWKRLLRRKQAGSLGLYTSTGVQGGDLMGWTS